MFCTVNRNTSVNLIFFFFLDLFEKNNEPKLFNLSIMTETIESSSIGHTMLIDQYCNYKLYKIICIYIIYAYLLYIYVCVIPIYINFFLHFRNFFFFQN